MAYNVHIDASNMRQRLHSIEQGGPVRNYEVPTLRAAVQIANAFRFGAGAAMLQGPRSLPVGQCYDMRARGGDFVISIQRLQPKG